MRTCLILCLAMLQGSPGVHSQTGDALHAMYAGNQVFALRDAVERTTAPLFFRAAVEVSANNLKAAERDLHSVIEAAPHSDNAYEAHDLLANMYFRNGMYPEGFREIVAALREKPDGGDANSMLPLASALNKLPRQMVLRRAASKMQIEHDSIFVPLRIDGKDAEYFFDTGAGISVMGQSESKRLGLVTKAVNGKMGEASGTDLTGLEIAVAADFVIGGLRIKNVPFIVLPDTGEPWNQLPQNRRGIIGLPILLAMQTVRWTPTGSFAFGFPAKDLHLSASNMLFHNSNPVVQTTVEGKHLDFTLDTGAVDTDLNPAFAKALPELLETGRKEHRAIEGLGGSDTYESVLLPSVVLGIDGQIVTLRPAHVFTEHGNGSWAAGNLGMDLLKQAPAFTLDFRAMTLRLK